MDICLKSCSTFNEFQHLICLFMAKYCSLRCWLRECDAPHCNPAGRGMPWGAGCSQGDGLRDAGSGGVLVWLPWAVPAGVIYQCHQPVCWCRAPEQYLVLGDTSNDSSLWLLSRMLFIMTFFLFLFHASALSLCLLCVCAQCQWQPALQLVSPMLVTKGTQGDVPAHKCQSKGWCRARQRLGSTAKKKDPVFTEGYTETKEIYQIVIC